LLIIDKASLLSRVGFYRWQAWLDVLFVFGFSLLFAACRLAAAGIFLLIVLDNNGDSG